MGGRMPTRAARSSTINIQGAMEKAEEARGESMQTSDDVKLKPAPGPRILAFKKPYGMPPCFTDDQGQPTLAECVTIPDVYAAG